MAKKVHSFTQFGGGYNSKIAPRDLKDDALSKSQGISFDRPGVLSVLGKGNHTNPLYLYDDLDTSTSILGDNRTIVQEPGSGLFSFTSEYTPGYHGRFTEFAETTGSPNPHIRISIDNNTPVFDKQSDGNLTDKIPIQDGDFIYIWGISWTSAVYDLNDRYFKVTGVSMANNTIDICDWIDGAEETLDMSKLTGHNGTNADSYDQASHGGFWRTVPEIGFTRYIATQNGECVDLYYDIIDSDNSFSKGWIPRGTLGLLANERNGQIGKHGGEGSLDIGLDNNFEKWPQSNGINYGIKPSFFFSDNVLRLWASNRVGRASTSDTNKYGNPRWFGHIHREKLFGIDSAVTNINEWYYTDANIRPPASSVGSFYTRVHGSLSTSNSSTTYVYDRCSWDTGSPIASAEQISANYVNKESKRFADTEKGGSPVNFPANVRWNRTVLLGNGEVDWSKSYCGTLNHFTRKGRGRNYVGDHDPSILPFGYQNRLQDGQFQISGKDVNDGNVVSKLNYWLSPGTNTFYNGVPGWDYHVTPSGVNSWTWNRNTTSSGNLGGSVSKTAGNTYSLYAGTGVGMTGALPEAQYYPDLYVTFTLTGCTDANTGSGLKVAVMGGKGTSREATVSTSAANIDNYHNITLKLETDASGEDPDTGYYVVFTPTINQWVGTISNVRVSYKNHENCSVHVIFSDHQSIDENFDGSDAEGWDKAEYEFFQTLIYDTMGKRKQESCATKMASVNFASHTSKKKLRLTPGVIFSSDGKHYDMMDKRIVGSNIYYRKKGTEAGGNSGSANDIKILVEMDWFRGCRQWGGGSSEWIPWTEKDLDDLDGSWEANQSPNNIIGVSPIQNTCVMPKVSGKMPFLEWTEEPLTNPDYESFANGHTFEEPGVCNARYGTMAAVNGTTYIGNVAIPKALSSGPAAGYEREHLFEHHPTMVIRSAPGKDDMFPFHKEQLAQSGLSESSVVKMYGVQKYLIVLCKESYYILDVENNTVFDNVAGNGIKNECQSISVDGMVAWTNDKGCFMFGPTESGGYSVVNLIEGVIPKNNKGWVNYNENSEGGLSHKTGLYYWDITDDGNYIPSIGFSQKDRKLIIKKSCRFTGNFDEGHVYLYDLYTKTWTTNINGIDDDTYIDDDGFEQHYSSLSYYSFAPCLTSDVMSSNFDTLSDGTLINSVKDRTNGAYQTGVYEWKNNPPIEDNLNNININFKELTFDMPHNIKRVYQIYVTYRCTGDSGADMDYGLDGQEDWINFRTNRNDTNYNNSFNDTNGKWEVASLLFDGPINCYSIQLRLMGRAIPSDFEINDITFVYKIKNVRVKI